jgi:hypothetical protein
LKNIAGVTGDPAQKVTALLAFIWLLVNLNLVVRDIWVLQDPISPQARRGHARPGSRMLDAICYMLPLMYTLATKIPLFWPAPP